MNPQELKNKFILEYNEALSNEIFPNEFLPENFSTLKNITLQFESPISINLPWSIHKLFASKSENFSLLEVAAFCNTWERRTIAETHPLLLKYGINYYNVQDLVQEIGVKWRELEKPHQETLNRKLQIGAIPMNGEQKTRFGKGSQFNQ